MPGSRKKTPVLSHGMRLPMMLMDFSKPRAIEQWATVDDVVMGGMSYSQIDMEPTSHAVFAGEGLVGKQRRIRLSTLAAA